MGIIDLNDFDILCIEQALLVVRCMLTDRITRLSSGSMSRRHSFVAGSRRQFLQAPRKMFMIAW